MTGPEVAEEAAAALEAAGAVHVQGSGTMDGMTADVDLHLQDADVVGSMTLDGSPIQIIFTAGTGYMQASAAFWELSGVPADAAAGLDGVWVVVPPEGGAMFGDFALAGLAEELRNPTDSDILDEVAAEELGGRPVVVVSRENGSTLVVAAEGTAYPLTSEDTGDAAGTMTYSRFGERVEIVVPTDALDLSQMGA
jgi:hypothetical protein